MAITIRQPVGNWERPPAHGTMNEASAVRAIQQLLTDVATKLNETRFRPRAVNGMISKPPEKSSTVAAITEFQRQVLLLSTPDGRVDPNGATLKGLNSLNESKGLEKLKDVHAELRKKVHSFIAQFGAVTISSAKRTITKQAELMAAMSDSDLNMYGATSPYIVKIKALPKAQRGVVSVEKILNDAIKQGSKISDHLQGNAVDISAQGAFSWASAEALARKLGLRPKNEKSRNCFHVSR